MVILSEIQQIRKVLQKFQDGYVTRNKSKLDEFMELFAPTDEIELIGVGASERGGTSGSMDALLSATSSREIGRIGARSISTWTAPGSPFQARQLGSPQPAR